MLKKLLRMLNPNMAGAADFLRHPFGVQDDAGMALAADLLPSK